MNIELLKIICCPVTRSPLRLEIIESSDTGEILTGILYADKDWFYPIIDSIPRLLIEAFIDHSIFFQQYLPQYQEKAEALKLAHHELIEHVIRKNKRTKASFSQEWKVYDRKKDKTWNLDDQGLVNQFLKETDESIETINGKVVFDAGCGNGQLDLALAKHAKLVVAMDFSDSIVEANNHNMNKNLFFLQGDVQYPPVVYEGFDIVHSSGVLIHTNNTEISFSRLTPCVKPGGKLSVWLYHRRKNISHQIMNYIRRFSSKLPLRLQYYLYSVTLFPLSYVIKKIKGNRQNSREMMVDILDWMTPEFRWEHSPAEAEAWFSKRNFIGAKITTSSTFGFNITGRKQS